MRAHIAILISCLVLFGCSKKESRLKEIEAEKDKQKQTESLEIGTTQSDSVPQRGFDALRDIKEIRNEEHARQDETKEIMDQVDGE